MVYLMCDVEILQEKTFQNSIPKVFRNHQLKSGTTIWSKQLHLYLASPLPRFLYGKLLLPRSGRGTVFSKKSYGHHIHSQKCTSLPGSRLKTNLPEKRIVLMVPFNSNLGLAGVHIKASQSN